MKTQSATMRKPRPQANQPQSVPSESPLQTLASLCTTLAVAFFIFGFVAQNFVIPSASMASTLLVGDHVLVDRASLAPPASGPRLIPYRPLRRGEPVVFFKPVLEPDGTNMILVKRVIGLPGDRIHLRDGVVYVNGVAQSEPYAIQPAALNFRPYNDDFPAVSPEPGDPNITATWALDLPSHIQNGDLVVPPDSYFVMGDNRAHSLDARYWGFVPRGSLIGRPLFVYWSIKTPDDQMDRTTLAEETAFTLHQLSHFLTETRWRRTLHPIR